MSVSPAQYILIEPAMITDSAVLIAKKSNHKIINLNCMSSINSENFLIHVAIFSDSNGIFQKRFFSKEQLNQMKIMQYDSMVIIAKTNTQMDQQRNITHFEYEGDYSKYPIINSGYKIIIKNDDNSYTVYENYAVIFFLPNKQLQTICICPKLRFLNKHLFNCGANQTKRRNRFP